MLAPSSLNETAISSPTAGISAASAGRMVGSVVVDTTTGLPY